MYEADFRPNARATYSRAQPIVQESLPVKFLHSILQRVWNRDYDGFYALMGEVESGVVQIEEPTRSFILEYKGTPS